MAPGVCQETEKLQRLQDGSLPAEQYAAMEAHVQQCAICLGRLKEMLATTATLADQANASRMQAVMQSFLTSGGGSPKSATDSRTAAQPSETEESEEEPWTLERIASYRIVKKLGEGGMGLVFEAFDEQLERKVAIKVMKPSLARNLGQRKRFLQEARMAAKIHHDHIVAIFQVSEDQGMPFLAMQLLEGLSLSDLIKRQGRMKIPQVLRLGQQIALGLDAAHSQGMIHRDIKPANVWIEPVQGGRAKILDFGLARTSESKAQLTQSGTIVGTPAYMAPEQARDSSSVDHRCDLFSLGCMLYQMVTGKLPFEGNDVVSTLMAVAMKEPPAPRQINADIPPALSDLILNLMRKDRDQRIGTAKEVAAALRAIERDGASANFSTQPLPQLNIPEASLATPISTSDFDISKLPTPPRTPMDRVRQLVEKIPLERKGLLIAGGAASLMLILCMGLCCMVLPSRHGTFSIESDDPAVQFAIDDEKPTPIGKSKKDYRAVPGEHLLTIQFTDVAPLQLEKIAIARGETIALKIERVGSKVVVSRDGKAFAERLLPQGGVPRGGIAEMQWSPDGTLLAATFPFDNKAVLIDATSLKVVKELSAGSELPRTLTWSPNGKSLVYIVGTGIRIVNAAGEQTAHYGDAPITKLAWHPKSEWLALGGTNSRLWLVRPDGSKRHELTKAGNTNYASIDWHPANGAFVACDGVQLNIWKPDVVTRPQFETKAPPGVNFVFWRPGEKLLALPALALMTADAKIEKSTSFNFNQGFSAATFHPNGDDFVASSISGQAWRFAKDGSPLSELPIGLARWSAMQFSSNGKYFSRQMNDGAVVVSEWGAGLVERARIQGRAAAATWNPTGKEIAIGESSPSTAGVLRIYDTAGKLLRAMRGPLMVPETPAAVPDLLAASAFDKLRREDILAVELKAAFDKAAPKELVAILGESQWNSPEPQTVIGISSDGKTLAANTKNGITLWDMQTGQETHQITAAQRLSADLDRAVLAGGRSFSVRATKTAERIGGTQVVNSDAGIVYSISPNGEWVGIGLRPPNGGNVSVWDSRGAKQVFNYQHGGSVNTLIFSPKSDLIASSAAGTVKITDFKVGAASTVEFKANASHLAFSADGKLIATCEPGPAIIWNAESGERIRTLQSPLKFHSTAFSPLGDVIASQADEGLDLWDPKTGEKVRRLADSAGCNAPVFTPDGKTIVATPRAGRIARFWDVATGEVRGEPQAHAGPLLDVMTLKDGESLLAGSQDRKVFSWDLKTRKPTLKATLGFKPSNLVIAPDARFAAYAGEAPSTVGLWNLDKNADYQTFGRHAARPPAAISPDRKYIVCPGGHGCNLHRLGEPRVDMDLGTDHSLFAAFSPDSQLVAKISIAPSALWVYHVAGGQQLFQHPGPSGPVVFHPGGTSLFCAIGGVLQQWDLRTLELARSIPGHLGAVQRLAIRPDGKWLASLDDKGTLLVRDLSHKDAVNLREIDLGEVGKTVSRIAFTPDGRHLVTANGNGTIYVLRLEAAK